MWRRNRFAPIATMPVIFGPSLLPAGRSHPPRCRPATSPLPRSPRHPVAHDGFLPHFQAAIPGPSSQSAPVQVPFSFLRAFAGSSWFPPSSSGVHRPSSSSNSPHPCVEWVRGRTTLLPPPAHPASRWSELRFEVDEPVAVVVQVDAAAPVFVFVPASAAVPTPVAGTVAAPVVFTALAPASATATATASMSDRAGPFRSRP